MTERDLPKEERPVSDAELLDRALRVRDPDLDAAYAVLGKQHPVDTWVAVITNLTRHAKRADLELVAHSTLRRPAPVVQAVLALAEAKASPQAAFFARVAMESRDEDSVVARARELNSRIASNFDLDVEIAGGNTIGSLYMLLATPLEAQAREVRRLAPDPVFAELGECVRSEYERLQEVSRDTRWRAGSYRHVLRHSLADIALLMRIGGRLEEQAFRLLQVRDDYKAQSRLLALLDAEVRALYLSWSLQRASADSSPERARFALSELARYPGDVDHGTITGLLASKEQSVAVAAAESLLRSNPSDGSNDRAIADLLDAVPEDLRIELLTSIIVGAPERIRVDLWGPSADPVVAAHGAGRSEVGAAVVASAASSREPDVRRRALALVAEIGETVRDGAVLARDAVGLALEDEQTSLLVDSSWARPALWAASDSLPATRRSRLLDELVAHESPATAANELAALFSRVRGSAREEIAEYVLRAVSAGQVSAAHLEDAEQQELVRAVTADAEIRAAAAEREVGRLVELIELGDRAAAIELADLVAPLVQRAVERSAGNDRLRSDYARLLAALGAESSEASPTSAQSVDLDEAVVEDLNVQLESTVRFERADGELVAAVSDADLPAAARAVALIDHRAQQLANPTTQAALVALSRALADAGVAQTLLADLFERGPTFQAVLGLSPSAREVLLRAAMDHGFEPSEAWREHPVLGEWLDFILSESSREVVPSTGSPLERLQSVERFRREAEAQLSEGRRAAKQSFVREGRSALEDLEDNMDAYLQLWLALRRVGISQVAALGSVLRADELETAKHAVIETTSAERYVVRSAGVMVDDEVIERARVEAYD